MLLARRWVWLSSGSEASLHSGEVKVTIIIAYFVIGSIHSKMNHTDASSRDSNFMFELVHWLTLLRLA